MTAAGAPHTLHDQAERRPGPLPGVLSLLGAVAEPLYRFEIGRRNTAFDAGRGVVRLDRPVVSIGNLTVGGTGKTPMVMTVVRWLRDAGLWPCVAMRGYAQRHGLSDEAAEYRAAFPDLPMVVQADRTSGLVDLFATDAGARVDCVLLDDGFQHRQIARDLDIVLIDATPARDPFRDRLLPRGWLREPVGGLRRAHAVVLTHAEGSPGSVTEDLRQRVAAVLPPGALVAVASHEWRSVSVFPADAEQGVPASQPVGWLAPRRTLACCAIGNPGAFLASARARTNVVGEVVLADHDPYQPATVQRIRKAVEAAGADTLLVTPKDWTKLAGRPLGVTIAVPELAIVLGAAAETLRGCVLAACAQRGADDHAG